MDYTDKYDKLLELMTELVEVDGNDYFLKDEFDKFFVMGNKTAGVRIRKIMQEIKKVCKEIRDDVQDYKGKL